MSVTLRRDPDAITARRDLVAELNAAGWSDVRIARELGVHVRTILRDRQAAGIPGISMKGTKAEHGTPTRYSAGCHCTPCRRAHADQKRDENHRSGRHRWYYVTCVSCGRHHHVPDLNNYTCTGEGS